MNYNMKFKGLKSISVAFISAALFMGISACNPKPSVKPEPVEVGFNGTIVAQAEVRSTGDAWEPGDEIGVFMLTAGKTLSDEALVENAFNRNFITNGNGKFGPVNVSHKLLFPTGDGKVDFVVYHPYTSDSRIKNYTIPVSVADQHAEKLYLLYSNSAKNAGSNSGTVSLLFTHMLSKIFFPITINGVEIENPEEVTITVKGMNTTADFAFADGKFTYTGSPSDITPVRITGEEEEALGGDGLLYEAVILPTAGTPAARSIVADIPGVGIYTLDIPAGKTFEPGKIYEYPIAVTVNGVTISTGEITDWTGKDQGVEQGVAKPPVRLPEKEWLDQPNTYVATPGTKVQIPVGKAYAMWYYDSLLGELRENLTGKMTAEIVWQEVSGLVPVNNISITGEGMDALINVQSDSDIGEGNAVVALKFGDNIYWTWQIWYTDYNPELTANQITNNGVTLMNRNLGSWNGTNSSNVGKKAGAYYQWGRKDPLRLPNDYMAGLDGIYDKNGTRFIPGAYHDFMKETAVENLIFSIRNPLRIIKNASGADWLFNSSTSLTKPDRWGKADGSKGIFDPCPAGWRVPNSGETTASPWYGMTLPPSFSIYNDKGVDFESYGFYAANGYFVGSTGFAASGSLGSHGYTWTAGLGETPGMIYCLHFTGTAVSPSHLMSSSNTMTVRCAKIN